MTTSSPEAPSPGDRERARIRALYAEHCTRCEACYVRQATRRGIDAKSMLRALCDACPDGVTVPARPGP